MTLALPSSDRISGDLVVEVLRPARDSGDALGGGPLFLTDQCMLWLHLCNPMSFFSTHPPPLSYLLRRVPPYMFGRAKYEAFFPSGYCQ